MDIKENIIDEILTKNVPSLFHFLDGYLNPNYGSTSEIIINFLKEYDNKYNNIKEDIKFYTNKIFNIEINLDNTKISFIFDKNIINFNITDTNINLEIDIIKIKKIIDTKYNIFTISNDEHATAINFFTKDNNLYMLSCNSGMGINSHQQHGDKYSPYIGYLIVKNYNESDDKYIESIKKICGILFIQQFYKNLVNITKIYELHNFNYKYNLCQLGTSVLFITNIFGENHIYNEELFTLEYNERDYKKLKTLNSLLPLRDKSIGIKIVSNQIIFTKPEGKYYIFFIKLCNSFFSGVKKIKLQTMTIIKNFNIPIEDFKSHIISIDDDIMTKNILHVFDDNVYINEQESGSCTWFSVYWSFLLYYIIHNNATKYKQIIMTLTEYCYDKIQKYFNKDSYTKILTECNENESYSVTLYLSLAKKLADLKIIGIDMFYNYQDNIYNIFDNYNEIYKKSDSISKSDILSKSDSISKSNILKRYPDAYISLKEKEENSKTNIFSKNKNTLQIKNIDDFDSKIKDEIIKFREYLKVYIQDNDLKKLTTNVFLFFHNNNKLSFSQKSYPDIYFIALWELYKTLNERDFFTKSLVKIDIKKEIIEIHKIDNSQTSRNNVEDILNCLIEKFNDITRSIIHEKGENLYFVKDYYNYLTYLNNIYKDYDYGFAKYDKKYVSYYKDEGNIEIIKISYFMEKFRLLLNVLHELNNISIKKEDIDILAKPAFSKDVSKYILKNIISKFTLEINNDIIDRQTKIFFNLKHSFSFREKYTFFDKNNDMTNEFYYRDYFKYDKINIDIYKSYVDYILKNPNIIFEDIDNFEKNRINKIKYDDSSYINYINYHIHYIYENEEIRDNLLIYFLRKYCSEDYNTIINSFKQYIKFSDLNNIKSIEDYYNNKYNIVIGTIGILLNINSFSGNNTFNITKNIIKKEEIEEKLKEIKIKTKTESEFIDFIINKKDEIFSKNIDYELIKKYFGDEIISDDETNKRKNDMFKINKNDFFVLNKINILNNLFNNNSHSLFLFEDTYDNKTYIHMLTDDFILTFDIDCIFFDTYSKITLISKIKKIYFNRNEIIKFSEIIEPFKYIIPVCGINLIYMNNNNYYITYFNNHNLSKNKGDDQILGKNTIDKTIITLKINSNNMMYFERGNDDNIKLICENYGVNGFNYIYLGINSQKEYESDAAYYITKRLSKKYDNDLFIKKIQNFRELAKYKVSEIDNENNIIELNKTYDIYEKRINEYGEISEIALQKLINKIQKCTINKDESKNLIYEQKLEELIKYYNKIIIIYAKTISYLSLSTLFVDKFIHTVNRYLSAVRYKNICNTLLTTKKDNLCSIIKIYNEQFNNKTYHFNYFFEIFFELIFGFEITDEQYDRYTSIINKYNSSIGGKIYEKRKKTGKDEYYENELQELTKINEKQESDKEKQEFIIEKQQNFYKYLVGYKQVGGNKNYPLHHFMMGKGKSSVITPLLILYFSLIHKKEIYIIVPEHLIKQTENTLMTYINIFNLNNIYILSDSQVKYKFLNGNFMENNKNKIMLIDEFDSVLDPLKSNYNLVEEKTKNVTDIYKIILYIVKEINKEILIDNINLSNFTDKSEDVKKLIIKDIKSIYGQIITNKLKENIHWGIHPEKCYAIPYLNKDIPLLTSNFSSCILTIFLTLYYYIVIKKNQLDTKLYIYLTKYKYIYNVFDTLIIKDNDTYDKLNNYIKNVNNDTQIKIFDEIFNIIIDSISLSTEQFNTSFIDILNIDKIFKIGYSGTLNIELPPIINNLFEDITIDIDEDANIKYAILNSKLIEYDIIDYFGETENLIRKFIKNENLSDYGALIDACGIFKNIDNYKIADTIHKQLNRIVIFLDKENNKLIIKDGKINKYNESDNYDNPFLYYSQTHIIGIDINQNTYPKILGLCTIDENTTYTTIAQAIFRLRKLNMGHSINFYIVNKNKINIKTQINLYKMLKKMKNKLNKKNIIHYIFRH